MGDVALLDCSQDVLGITSNLITFTRPVGGAGVELSAAKETPVAPIVAHAISCPAGDVSVLKWKSGR